MERKQEGFKDQKSITLPQFLEEEMKMRPLTRLLFLTAIGFYPIARYHYRERIIGSDQNILIYCIEGKGWIELNRELHRVHKDQFFIIPAHVPHKYGSENSDPWTIYWIHFTGEIATNFVKSDFPIKNSNPIENIDNDRRVRLFEEIYRNLSMGFSHENLDYSSICLWHLLGTFCYVSQYERLISIQQNDIIEKSILFMQKYINKKINLSDLALHCGLSIPQYSRTFKKKTLSSPMKYYNNLRIQRSCQMIDFTNMNIKEIANHLDFEDQFYFSRLFRKVMGVSPAEYRKRKKG